MVLLFEGTYSSVVEIAKKGEGKANCFGYNTLLIEKGEFLKTI